ncbi:mannitol dehydrogenase family protein [Hymenobacter cellulosilyticus]|uniref:mannitol dehydrogenase family protein n=1 Tax=Hymenobacter cellulosilyticus TaxID=2932248 RepID=UPI0028806277|nr:hypothetical protein [Hymenobacter cellulosilyticus]
MLYARYQAFNGAADKGLVIVPTELIPNNGTKLESIVLELAHLNGLDAEFIEWLESANSFCNSLVDRIVPGRPDAATQAALEAELGYSDDLLTMSEAYLLWAIEGDARVKSVLSFEQADAGVIVQPNIDLFRELKLRLLNGTHTLSCGLAYLAGFDTVRGAMDDAAMAGFIQNLMLADLLPGIPYNVDEKVGQRFGMQVLDRFRNPYIEHRWLGITLNYTMKIQMRNVPTLLHYYKKLAVVPDYMALGFAAYLLFMRGTQQHDDVWYGEANGQAYPIQDEKAGYFADLWQRQAPAELIGTVLRNKTLWAMTWPNCLASRPASRSTCTSCCRTARPLRWPAISPKRFPLPHEAFSSPDSSARQRPGSPHGPAYRYARAVEGRHDYDYPGHSGQA